MGLSILIAFSQCNQMMDTPILPLSHLKIYLANCFGQPVSLLVIEKEYFKFFTHIVVLMKTPACHWPEVIKKHKFFSNL